MHQISYNNSTKEYSNYKLISQCQPTKDEINRVIQIENGQILVTTRDQHLILFNNKITKGKFEKLFEIKKKWPMRAISLFEIRNNLIGVFWNFDDAEKDEIIKDINIMKKYHSNDGIYIYSIQNNKIIHKKTLFGSYFSFYSYAILDNKLILTKDQILDVFNLNNFELMFELKENSYLDIYPFNEKYFSIFYKEGTKVIIKLYNIKSMRNEQTFEFQKKNNGNYLFPISNNEYMFDGSIITIARV